MLNPNLLLSLPEIPCPVLSVYLDTDRAESGNCKLIPAYLIWLRCKASALADELTLAEKDLFFEQVVRVEEYLNVYRPRERGLAVFAGPHTWEVLSLPSKATHELSWGRPALFQLLWLMDDHRASGVVLLTRNGARFYLHWLGELTPLEEKEFSVNLPEWRRKDVGKFARTGADSVAGIHKSRGSQRDAFEQRMAAQYRHFYREIAGSIQLHWPPQNGGRTIFLVGLEQMVTGVLEELPAPSRERLVLVRKDLGWVSRADLARRLEPIIREWDRKREISLVESLLKTENGAVLGIDGSLLRLQQGCARSLVVEKDLETRLYRCEQCGWTDRVGDPYCTVCQGKRHSTSLREAVPGLVRRFGTAIEIVDGDAAQRLHEAGGMGAWLRQGEVSAVSREIAPSEARPRVMGTS